MKFTDRGGVVFSVERESSEVMRFMASDSGPGIAPEDLAKLFQPFTQVGENTGTGTGLGLAIAHQLIRAWVEGGWPSAAAWWSK